jgi:hypothetical protein
MRYGEGLVDQAKSYVCETVKSMKAGEIAPLSPAMKEPFEKA